MIRLSNIKTQNTKVVTQIGKRKTQNMKVVALVDRFSTLPSLSKSGHRSHRKTWSKFDEHHFFDDFVALSGQNTATGQPLFWRSHRDLSNAYLNLENGIRMWQKIMVKVLARRYAFDLNFFSWFCASRAYTLSVQYTLKHKEDQKFI